jgi:hypothetical protein
MLPALTAPAATAATTPAPATAATRPSTATTAAIAATAAARRFGASLIYVERPSVELGSVQMGDRRFGLARIGHFHKSESARLAGAAIGYDIHAFNGSVLSKGREELVLSSLVAEVPDKNIGHAINPLWLSGHSILSQLYLFQPYLQQTVFGTQTQYQKRRQSTRSRADATKTLLL